VKKEEIMKSFAKLSAIALVVTAVSAFVPSTAFAQASDTEPAVATANIIAPIALTKVTDLVFGDIVPNATASTVIMNNAGTITGGTGTALASTRNSAIFNVTGQAGRAYTVSAIGDITIGNVLGAPMIINSTSDCGGGAGGCVIAAVGGSQVRVGGTLNVGANQVAALYTGNFNVTVTYN